METKVLQGKHKIVQQLVTFLFMGKAIEWKLAMVVCAFHWLFHLLHLPLYGEGDRMET